MTLRMVHDLIEFLKLALLVVMAFAGAFYVLVHAAAMKHKLARDMPGKHGEASGDNDDQVF